MKKFAGEEAGRILNEQMVNGVAAARCAHGLAAHHPRANGVDAVGLDVLYVAEMDAIFITEGQVKEQVLEGKDPTLGEQFRALRTYTFNHANFGGKSEGHRQVIYTIEEEKLAKAGGRYSCLHADLVENGRLLACVARVFIEWGGHICGGLC